MTLIDETTELMNTLGSRRIPFLFVFDFLMQQPVVKPLNEIDPEEIQFLIHGEGNQTNEEILTNEEIVFTPKPPDFHQ
jgi:para-aminobenzoate synthetase component 1